MRKYITFYIKPLLVVVEKDLIKIYIAKDESYENNESHNGLKL